MRLAALAFLVLACSPAADTPVNTPRAERHDFDVRIVGGEVIDGTGAARRRADIGIRGDTIAAIGDLRSATATVTVDATGKIVAPGFIDLLGNSQAAVLIDPLLEGKVRQGVTTEVTGEGHSPGPIDEPMAAEMERTKPEGWPGVSWRTLGGFMKEVEKRGSAVNFAFYIGATNPREMVLGHAERAPNSEELQRMAAIVAEAKKEGAVGLASALIYPPGRFATTTELVAMAREAGGYWTHLRNEADRIDAAIDEAILIGREAKVPVNIFHLKIGGRGNWGRMPEIVRKIEAAQKSGLDIAANVYPYTATSTDLTSIVQAWALEGGYEQFINRLKDPPTRARVVDAVRGSASVSRFGGPAGILIRGSGKRLDEIAREMGVEPAEAVVRLFEQSPRNSPIAIYFSLSEDDMKYALKQPWVSLGSDSGAVVGPMRNRGAHPRAYGTFARVLGKYVRDEKLMTLEEAIRKMTSLAASRANLRDRGILREGLKADVAVFDPRIVRDVSTYEDPHHFSEGVSDVFVNGTAVLSGGKMTGKLPGRMLRNAIDGTVVESGTGQGTQK